MISSNHHSSPRKIALKTILCNSAIKFARYPIQDIFNRIATITTSFCRFFKMNMTQHYAPIYFEAFTTNFEHISFFLFFSKQTELCILQVSWTIWKLPPSQDFFNPLRSTESVFSLNDQVNKENYYIDWREVSAKQKKCNTNQGNYHFHHRYSGASFICTMFYMYMLESTETL